MILNSPLLAPARFVYRKILKFKPLRNFIEHNLIYPNLAYVKKCEDKNQDISIIAGFFTSVHGIGEAARLELKAMRDEGKEVFGVDISPAFGLCEIPAPEGVFTAAELKNVVGAILLHCNAPETGRALQYLGKSLVANRYKIGSWAWELDVPPKDWNLAYKYLDELWVISSFTANAFNNAPMPVTVHPLSKPISSVADGGHSLAELGLHNIPDNAFIFLCMADVRSDLKRKNISGNIRAFLKAFSNNPRVILIVKIHHATNIRSKELDHILSLSANYSNIHILDKLLSQSERNSLIHRCHGIVSLHRAEGFGLLLIEALILNKIVIATNYSGNTDFMNNENSILIPYELIPVKGDTENYAEYSNALWAEPDIEYAAKAMKRVVDNHFNSLTFNKVL